MLNKSETTDCNSASIQSSKFLTLIALFAYSAVGLAILLSGEYFAPIILLLPIVARDAYISIRLNCLRTGADSIVYYQQISKDKWLLKTRAGKRMWGRPCTSAFRSKYFVKISFQTHPNKRTIKLLVAFDAITRQKYARLVSSLWDQD
ncbi:MAG: hypothetical protein JSR17_02560 [Proteobacteria bacterium]|nr:hypothetical protein [Pseudomonadota bacterium]